MLFYLPICSRTCYFTNKKNTEKIKTQHGFESRSLRGNCWIRIRAEDIIYTLLFLLTHNRAQIIAELVNFFVFLFFTLHNKKYYFFVIIAPKNDRAQDARKEVVTTPASKRTRGWECGVMLKDEQWEVLVLWIRIGTGFHWVRVRIQEGKMVQKNQKCRAGSSLGVREVSLIMYSMYVAGWKLVP